MPAKLMGIIDLSHYIPLGWGSQGQQCTICYIHFLAEFSADRVEIWVCLEAIEAAATLAGNLCYQAK